VRIYFAISRVKSIEIENNLEQTISVLVEFIAPIDDYTIKNATIKQVREKDDMAAYYVTSIINQESIRTITLE